MSSTFVIGQRWLSEAEPDLGLGIVVETDGRQVAVDFPAAGVRRTYAAQLAPLARIRCAPGDTVEDAEGRAWRVESVDEAHGLLRYQCVDPIDGSVDALSEQRLSARLRFNRPQDRLLARRIDSDVWFDLRYRTWRQNARLWSSPVYGFAGPRIEWLPHQLYIAAEVASRSAPRVLLADEVGLGKTIEAGLILHRLTLTERVQRVLLIVPEPLVHQWLIEMLRRFNLVFSVFDVDRFTGSDAFNPFEGEQRVLCSLSLLTATPEMAGSVVAAEWDLLIVDEAHHLTWTEDEASPSYRLIEALAGRTPAVLLLTATPEQLGRAGHFGRLRLLDPKRFHDYRDFLAEEADYEDIAAIAASLLDGVSLEPRQRARLAAWLGDESELPPEQVIARLIDRHGTGRVLFRNTRHAISGFPSRELTTYPLPLPEAYRVYAGDICPEQSYGEGWPAIDPRVRWLLSLCRELAPQKVLVICAHAATVTTLRDHLLERAALHAAVFHEGLDIVARDRAAAFFADPEQGAQVLLCSEIGSEGRNFQFAHHLVMFDLPFEPDLLEQRIGRLDRIGQRDTISIHVPFLCGSAADVLMQWYRDALGSFEAICPAGPAIHARLAERLREAMVFVDRLPSLLVDGRRLTEELNGALERGRDRLLELHSYRPEPAARLLESLRSLDASGLPAFLTQFWDAFGVEHEPGPGDSIIVRQGPHMLGEHFPGLLSEGVTASFGREEALAHEDRQFLTWEHPMVRGCMDLLMSGSLGSAAVTVCRHADFRTGTVFLEVLYVIDCPAPAELEMPRFLPPTCIRLLLDAQGSDRSARIAHEDLHGLCLAKNRKLADTVVRSQHERLGPWLERAETLANEQTETVVTSARQRVMEELGHERQRLAALARVNPNVRDEELTELRAREARLVSLLDDVRVRLDALRLIVMR